MSSGLRIVKERESSGSHYQHTAERGDSTPANMRKEVNSVRTQCRKTAIVRAVDLRDRRQRLGLTADRMADYLEVADCKHVSAIEIGRCMKLSQAVVQRILAAGEFEAGRLTEDDLRTMGGRITCAGGSV